MFCLIGSDGSQYTGGIPPLNDMPNSNTVSNFRIILIITEAAISNIHTHTQPDSQYTQAVLAWTLQQGTERKRLKPLTVLPPMRLSWQGAHENHLEEL